MSITLPASAALLVSTSGASSVTDTLSDLKKPVALTQEGRAIVVHRADRVE